MKQILILVFTLAIVSCKNHSENRSAEKKFTHHNVPIKTFSFDFIKQINDPNVIISALDNTDDLESAAIGITGEKTLSYAYFERLTEIASDSFLLNLTYNTNPKLRVYAMWGLVKNNKSLALSQLSRFKKDTNSLTYCSGCLILTLPVSLLVTNKFDSIERKSL